MQWCNNVVQAVHDLNDVKKNLVISVLRRKKVTALRAFVHIGNETIRFGVATQLPIDEIYVAIQIIH